jgi:hypothetical protein
MADMPVFTVIATVQEFDLGIHYDRAEVLAENAGYESPFVCFDHTEQPALVAAVRLLGQFPPAP